MKKILSSLIVICAVVFNSFSQSGLTNGYNFTTGSNNSVRFADMPPKKGETQGSYYYSEEWYKANITLTDDSKIENIEVKINLQDKNLELQVEGQVKVLSFYSVKNFVLKETAGDVYFYNVSLFSENKNKETSGFYKVLVDKKVKLMSIVYLELLPSNYNAAMDAGNNYDKYVKKEKYYVLVNQELKQISKTKSSILKTFDNKSEQVNDYAKENSLKYKNTEDLVKIVEYYNSIL